MSAPHRQPSAPPSRWRPTETAWRKYSEARSWRADCDCTSNTMNPPSARPDSLLIRNIHTLLPMDAAGSRLQGGFLYSENGEIKLVGTRPPPGLRPGRIIEGRFAIAVPGLVNTHHHLFQTLTRACRDAAGAELFDWLRRLYPCWARLDEEAVHVAAVVGMAELLLSGCTTTADHHYVFPRGQTRLVDAEIAAARRIGIRFHATRGSMDVGQRRGGLPPDSVVQSADDILADSERLIRKYHDPWPGSMLQIALAPCSPFTVSPRLMRETAELARKCQVRLHTHLAETRDEQSYCLGRNGVAHCPTSNMRLASGIAPALALARAGCPVGLGVDGSASNDSSHMLAEARQALLLNRLAHGASAVSVEQALRMATVEGARCLGRSDIGALQPGKRADVALFDLRDIGYSGAEDAVSALLLCSPARVRTLVVEGKVVVEDHQLKTISLEPVLRSHRRIAA